MSAVFILMNERVIRPIRSMLTAGLIRMPGVGQTNPSSIAVMTKIQVYLLRWCMCVKLKCCLKNIRQKVYNGKVFQLMYGRSG